MAEYQCPECKAKGKMVKAGLKWSGRNRVQRFLCNNCGLMTINPIIISRKTRSKKK